MIRPTRRNGRPCFLYPASRDAAGRTDVMNDDLAVIHLQYSTQWDSFAHAGQMFDADGDGVPEQCFYNGFRGGADVVWPSNATGAFEEDDPTLTSAARAVGIETIAETCVQGRGVMVDLRAHEQAVRDPVRVEHGAELPRRARLARLGRVDAARGEGKVSAEDMRVAVDRQPRPRDSRLRPVGVHRQRPQAWPRRKRAAWSWNCFTLISSRSACCQYGAILSW